MVLGKNPFFLTHALVQHMIKVISFVSCKSNSVIDFRKAEVPLSCHIMLCPLVLKRHQIIFS